MTLNCKYQTVEDVIVANLFRYNINAIIQEIEEVDETI